MAFQTHTLPSQIIAIVEVGSYRIKVCICEFKNDKVHILWYGEKRQSTSYFINGECRNLELLGTSIRDAISKTEKDNHIHVDKVVINYPFGELYFHHHKLSYKRDNESQLITKVELEKILKKTEKIVLEKCFKSIEKKSGFMETDMRLIISSILSFKIDKVPYERIIAESWRDIVVSLLNMFIPIDKSNHIKYIGGIIQKDITKIIPTEFSLRTIFKQKNIVIINIWAIYTSITIKSEWNIIGISKIPIWVNDLVGMVVTHGLNQWNPRWWSLSKKFLRTQWYRNRLHRKIYISHRLSFSRSKTGKKEKFRRNKWKTYKFSYRKSRWLWDFYRNSCHDTRAQKYHKKGKKPAREDPKKSSTWAGI